MLYDDYEKGIWEDGFEEGMKAIIDIIHNYQQTGMTQVDRDLVEAINHLLDYIDMRKPQRIQ